MIPLKNSTFRLFVLKSMEYAYNSYFSLSKVAVTFIDRHHDKLNIAIVRPWRRIKSVVIELVDNYIMVEKSYKIKRVEDNRLFLLKS